MSESELRLNLIEFLKPRETCPHGILVLVDDAHWLNANLLDELRVLSGIVHDGEHRCHLVLTGNRTFEEALADPQNDSLAQRVASRTYLGNLSSLETPEYVRIHLRRAGGGNRQFFTDDALQKVYDLTRGIPRTINQLCDHALVLCALNGHSIVDDAVLNQAWQEVQQFPIASSTGSVSSGTMTAPDESWSTIEYGLLDLDEAPATSEANSPASDADSKAPRAVERRESERHEHEAVTDRVHAAKEPQTNWTSATDWSAESYETTTNDDSERTINLGPDKTTRRSIASSNPFEEDFEEVEDVPLRVIELSSRHNASAVQLTRNDIPESQRSDASHGPSESAPPYQMSPSLFAETSTPPIAPEVVTPPSYQASDLEAYITMIESRRQGVTSTPPKTTPEAKDVARVDTREVDSIPSFAMDPSMDPRDYPYVVPRSLRMHSVANETKKTGPTDDRDMIVVNRPHPSNPAVIAEENKTEGDDVADTRQTPIGKGKAIRIEYRQLFDQLRQAQS
jgi:hypothetical protein